MQNFLIIYSVIFGLIMGSFLDCLLWRLKKNQSLFGRSFCPQCRATLAWYDNIPLLSFLLLRGRCRRCRHAISWQYPLIEAVTGLLFGLAFWYLTISAGAAESWSLHSWLQLLRDWIFLFALIGIFISDLRWYLIFDEIAVPAGLIVFGLNILLGASWPILLLSATIGTGFFLIQYLVSRGKWLGGGDIRLGFLLGAGLGWPLLLPALMSAYLLGALVGVGLLIAGRKEWGSELPLGTFLCAGALLALWYGQPMIAWYLHLIHLS